MISDADNVNPSGIENDSSLAEMLPIKRGLIGLFHTLQDYLGKEIELERLCRVAVLLCHCGVDVNNSVFEE